MKKLTILIAIFALSSCFSGFDESKYLCPNIKIPRTTAYVTQKAAYSEEVQIEVIGFEGYCLKEESVNRSYAMIKPLFKIQRLKDAKDTTVDFPFYTEAVKGPPEFLGKKRYFASVTIPVNQLEKEFAGKEVKVRIPNENQSQFEILLGMDFSQLEYDYNQKTFDIKYRYLSPQELKDATNIRVQEEVTEVDEQEVPVQYIEIRSQPVRAAPPVKKKSGCSSCRL